ncbi:leucine-rich repeat-containing protein 47-like [Mya arenaria]|uniref:leucine-rich repeat-containing protein 47-like n=1 Tax=Mya arenaria TaxID=6604 RepID=UPI0022E506A6|nr:leucine-rich repeat-containing protein 47-like [Mya arenaria]
MAAWEEISQAVSENRRELVLQGATFSKRIEKSGLDERLYSLSCLNHLEISGTTLSTLKSDIEKLTGLTSLVLCNNHITSLPSSVGKLTKLKLLNVSNNQLEEIPDEIGQLTELDTLNLSMNKLTEIPSVSSMRNLHVINISSNKLTSLPEGIFDPELVHLSHIIASDNEITDLPVEVDNLPHLNVLDLSNNKLTDAPTSLSVCPKLKELNLKGNKFKDRRFGKMIEQCQTKSVLEYLHNIWKKENQKANKSGGKDKEKKKKKKGKKVDDIEVIKNMMNILKFHADSGIVVTVNPSVLAVRQYIVCCVVRDLDLSGTGKLKSFITQQTKLHDTVCQKRQAGTIATHDLKNVKMPLTYNARSPQILQIVPLFHQKEVSGEKLFEDLRREAEQMRKEKKRHNFSGIHKYLELLADKTEYPCLVDSEGTVISFPPITNSDKTKISINTTDILVEVTSSTSLDTCKKIMDEVLYKMLELGLGKDRGDDMPTGAAKGNDSDSDSDEGVVFTEGGQGEGKKSPRKLLVEQVKVVDLDGGLKVLYPSRTDLPLETIDVIRNFD